MDGDADDVLTVPAERAGCVLLKTRDGAQEGGFSGARSTQDRGDLAAIQREVDVVDDGERR